VALIGDTGTGKNAFGNVYLGSSVFDESESPDPAILETTAQSAIIYGLKRWVIIVQGLANGQHITAEQIQNMALLLKDWRPGVNGIAILLNGQNDQFSQGIQDVIRFVCNAFGIPDVLSHICIVFTCCYRLTPNRPNREQKRTEYTQLVQAFLSQVSGLRDVRQIPVFFVDSGDLEGPEMIKNLTQFHGSLTSKDPLLLDHFVLSICTIGLKTRRKLRFSSVTKSKGIDDLANISTANGRKSHQTMGMRRDIQSGRR
jgi:hypothetical protein